MLQFLSRESCQLMQDLMPFLGNISAHRIVNYLSFYLSRSSKHLYQCPNLLSNKALQDLFAITRRSIERQEKLENGSIEHLFAKSLLSVRFQDHIMDEQGSLRLYAGLARLKALKKQDILQEFLKSKCKISSTSGRITALSQVPPQHCRSIYIFYPKLLPDSNSLFQTITLNPLIQLSNLNKILFFQENAEMNLQLPQELQKFCMANQVKIKLLKDHGLPSALEYISSRSKRNILIHQTIDHQHQIFDLKTPQNKQKQVKNKIVNSQYFKLMPREITVFCQRLPKSSVVTDNKQIVLDKMRQLLGLQPNQSLMEPKKILPFSELEKNYLHEDIDGIVPQTNHGFSIRRYTTAKIYQQNRKEEEITNNPFNKK